MLQVLQWVLSYDGDNQTEGLAITAASAALAMSGRGPFRLLRNHKTAGASETARLRHLSPVSDLVHETDDQGPLQFLATGKQASS